jgi:hypothetical protein
MYIRTQEFQHVTLHLIKRLKFFIDKAIQSILLVSDCRYIGKRDDQEAEFIKDFIHDILLFRREGKETISDPDQSQDSSMALQSVGKGQGASPLAPVTQKSQWAQGHKGTNCGAYTFPCSSGRKTPFGRL